MMPTGLVAFQIPTLLSFDKFIYEVIISLSIRLCNDSFRENALDKRKITVIIIVVF